MADPDVELSLKFQERDIEEGKELLDVHHHLPWIVLGRHDDGNYNLQAWNYENDTRVDWELPKGIKPWGVKFVGQEVRVMVVLKTQLVEYEIPPDSSSSTESWTFALDTTDFSNWAVHSSRRRVVLAVHPPGSSRYNIYFWDLDQNLHEERGTNLPEMTKMCFHPLESDIFVTVHGNGTINIWNAKTMTVLRTLEAEREVTSVRFCTKPQTSLLITGHKSGKLQVWDYPRKKCLTTFDAHEHAVEHAFFHPQLPYILSASEDGAIKVWSDSNYQFKMLFSGLNGLSGSLLCGNDNTLVRLCKKTLRVITIVGEHDSAAAPKHNFSSLKIKQLETGLSTLPLKIKQLESVLSTLSLKIKQLETVLSTLSPKIKPLESVLSRLAAIKIELDVVDTGPIWSEHSYDNNARQEWIGWKNKVSNMFKNVRVDIMDIGSQPSKENIYSERVKLLETEFSSSNRDGYPHQRVNDARKWRTVVNDITKELETKLQELQTKLLESQAELAKLQAELAKLQAELAKLQAELAKLQAELSNLRLERQAFEKELERLQSEYDTERGMHSERVKQIGTELSTLRAERRALEEGFEKKRQTKHQRVKELDTELSNVRMQRQALGEKVERFQSMHDREKGMESERVKQLETELSSARAERMVVEQGFEEERQIHAKGMKELETELSDVRTEMQGFGERFERFQSEHETEKGMHLESIMKLENEISNLLAEREELEESFEKPTVGAQGLECRSEMDGGASEILKRCDGVPKGVSGGDMHPFREFSVDELKNATNSFHDDCKLEQRHYGCMYKGKITPVVVKRLGYEKSTAQNQHTRLTMAILDLLKSLQHPHLQTLLGVCYKGNCLVYEHMAHGNVKDWISSAKVSQSGFLPWYIRLRIIAQVAQAVSFLHSHQSPGGGPIVHCSITLDNIFLDNSFVAKIANVDMAVLAPVFAKDGETPDMNRSDVQYLAPEFFQTEVFTPETDTYAFGITLLEMLTGKFKNALGIMKDAVEDATTFRSTLDPNAGSWDIDLALEAARVGLRCASLNKHHRPSITTGEGAVLPALESIAHKVELADSLEEERRISLCGGNRNESTSTVGGGVGARERPEWMRLTVVTCVAKRIRRSSWTAAAGGFASGRKGTNGGATARKGHATKTRRSKKMDDGTGRSDGEGGRNFWSVGDTIALVRAKRDQDLYIIGMGTSFPRMKTREWKWEDVRARLQSMGVTRDVVDCGKKWDNLMQQFKKVHKFHNLSGGRDYFKLASKARRSEGFIFVMDRSVYDEMEAMTKGDHMIHPKNLANTGAVGGVQMPAGAGAARDTMATEGGGEAADEEPGSTKDSTFSAGSGSGYRKRKNMRQQTFEVVAEVMDKHGALMASTMDSVSKRQCSMMLRQCEILESEVEVQRKHYAAADEANGMISEGRRTRCTATTSTRDALCLFSSSSHNTATTKSPVSSLSSSSWISSMSSSIIIVDLVALLLAADLYRPFGGPASFSHEDLLLAAEQCPQGSSPSRLGLLQCRCRSSLWILSLSFSPRILLAADPYRPFGGPASLSREDLLVAAEKCPQGSSPSRVRPQTAIDGGGKHVCARRRLWEEAGNIPADNQGRERGRRHVPKAKRLRSEEASASLPLRRGRSWTLTNVEEDDDVFTTEEEAAEDNVLAPRGSSLQSSSDQSGARRLVTPPPEAQQVSAHNTQKAKEVVVDVGGEDDEPLESRRQRNVTQGATATAVSIRAATEERPPQGDLPSTPSQPRPRNTAAEGGSMERGGGEGALQEACVASGGAITAAAAGSSGNDGVVARAREEVPVVEREAMRSDNKGERENEDPLLNRVRRGGMARDLADRARLWVDDKAFWTTGEGRRLHNIVHESLEYFVAIASGLQTPVMPRSVIMPKSSTTLIRIADPAQLQQVIARVTAAENIALRVLHGWVFKSGNRPRGFNVAFQYVLELVATDIARVMWYGKEWSNVVSAVVHVHTIDLNMDLPLWFAGANIEDRLEDDDMTAHQEATVICITHAFRAAVQMGGIVDGGFISHNRLSRIADCFRLLLAACMWLMCMEGDNPRSHYQAFYFAKLVAKPTLVASMHRAFDHRRSVIRATNVVTERLGKANATFGE
ncbi:hypothetical protein CBR_g37091 [Chara braunii]|uniref:Protein kinase domain-containing protein n=1 Tax=Chara braunii TaxID=69332 RepID=A0A388LM44_CHABU|nr:hypothetical protein CBR_g37091 [Chara braunii]|eukprot:GBG83377.1 hypothetical protein CBR_g37091 [Chara braunii]